MILKSDQVVRIRPKVFLAQLHHRMWHQPGTRVFQSDWLLRAKAQRISPAASDLLNRQTALKIVLLLPFALLDRLRGKQRVIKAVILFILRLLIAVIGGTFLVTLL